MNETCSTTGSDFQYGQLLAEILRLQRWAGGDAVPADRIFGLMHGFETVLCQERASGISEETQGKVEDLLDDVEAGKQSVDGLSIKDRLRRDGVDETHAALVMQLCLLQSRFLDGIEKLVSGQGSVFAHLRGLRLPEMNWFGALHYMELVDCSEGVETKMHAVYAPCVPRIGEIVEPQRGSQMRVVDVRHVVVQQGQSEGVSQAMLVPHVLLEAIDQAEHEE